MNKKIVLLTITSILILTVFITAFLCITFKPQKTITDLYKEENYEQIIENYNAGEYEELINFKEKQYIADAFFKTENFEESEKIYGQILLDKSINDLERAEILYSHSMTLVKLKKIDEAFTALQEGIEESTADLTVSRKLKRSYGLLARSFPREYNIENALLYLKDAIDLDIQGNDYEANYSYALLLYYAEEYDGSLKYCEQALKIKYDFYLAETLMPKIYHDGGNFEMAVSYLDSLIRKYPTDTSIMLYLAQIYEMSDYTDLALKNYKKALEFDKENIEIHMGLIRCYLSLNKINSLIEELVIFSNTFDTNNQYQEIIDKLIVKYVPKMISKEELEEIQEEKGIELQGY